jgi:aspartate beta-hydroxylase
VLSRRKRYYDPSAYPEIDALRTQTSLILGEARATLASLGDKMKGDTFILPLVPEPEDRHPVADPIWAAARALSPQTTVLLTAIPYVVAFAYSKLAASGHIAEHEHWNPYLVAILCLDDGGGRSFLRVGGERRDFRDGELLLFDYTLPHEAVNEGERDRIVLLISIDPRQKRQGRE